MANIKSAEKKARVSETKRLQNKMVLSQMKTAVKKFNAAVAANDAKLAEELMTVAASKIDNAASKGVIHKNAANRKKSQIASTLHQLKSGVIVVKVDAKTLKQTEQKAGAARKAEEKAASISAYKEQRAKKDEEKLIKKDPKLAKKIAKQKAAKGVQTVEAPALESAVKTETSAKTAKPKAVKSAEAVEAPALEKSVKAETKAPAKKPAVKKTEEPKE